MRVRAAEVLNLVGTAARLGLVAVWLISGALKAADPDQTYLAVRAYDVLPLRAVSVVAATLPVMELALGALLLLGIGVRPVAIVSAGLLLVFTVGVVQAWARGLSIDCGCFGGGGQVTPGATSYGPELLREAGMLVLAGWLMWRPRSYFALDGWLTRRDRARLAEKGK